MANNEMYEAPGKGESQEQLDAYRWLKRNGYDVAGVVDTVAMKERVEALQAIGNIYVQLASAGFKFEEEKHTTWIPDDRSII